MNNYKNLTEKKSFYGPGNYHKIENLSELQEFMKETDGKKGSKKYAYRGMVDARYKIYSSFQREWIGNGLKSVYKGSYKDCIDAMIQRILGNKTLDDYYKALKVVPNDWNALCFLQHYGAPTPLVDFTYNIDVALWFATEQGNDDCDYFSIIRIDVGDTDKMRDILHGVKIKDKEKLRETDMKSLFQHLVYNDLSDKFYPNPNKSEYKHVLLDMSADVFKSIITTNRKDNIDCNYYVGNLNMSAQDGVLLFLNDEERPLEEVMQGKIQVFDIKKDLCKYIGKYFADRKITADSLFPDQNKIAKDAFLSNIKLK